MAGAVPLLVHPAKACISCVRGGSQPVYKEDEDTSSPAEEEWQEEESRLERLERALARVPDADDADVAALWRVGTYSEAEFRANPSSAYTAHRWAGRAGLRAPGSGLGSGRGIEAPRRETR